MLHRLLEPRLQAAVAAVLPDADLSQVLVRPCPDAQHGDFQTSALIALAKARRMPPRDLASRVVEQLNVQDLVDRVEVAGPGFLNFRLRPESILRAIQAAVAGEHLCFAPSDRPRTVVVDFSSPNVAKAMHVGHIRSTILGDCLARVLRLMGHRVITDNHLGDWGTQFGKLLVGWKTRLNTAALAVNPLAEMERLYKDTHTACESDPALLESARRELLQLQQGDATNLSLWQQMIALSRAEFDRTYARLGVHFDHTLGESFYNPRLKSVVAELEQRGIARESEGARVVFFDDLPELKAHPALIQKNDGAANYATTDLATLAYRLDTWHPDDIVYVTDGRQQLHFKQVFATFRQWRPDAARIRLAHVWFGSILGEDGKPFRTRSGETIKLADLLDEAEERALAAVTSKNPTLPEAERRAIARVVGLGAIKYADLLPNRQSDYVFSWDKMLSLSGNTAPYLLYAYTRIRSIFRRLDETDADAADWAAPAARSLVLAQDPEIALAKHLLRFGLVLEAVAEDYRPNYLCNYLYDLAGHFTAFYENCPVLKAANPERYSRLALCDLTARILRQGLELLGIETTEQM